ncbi:MAG: hypothetical protein Q9190_002283 [Brigantiaea leucoxantha]
MLLERNLVYLAALSLTALTATASDQVDKALQHRQNIPIGTGVSTTPSVQTSALTNSPTASPATPTQPTPSSSTPSPLPSSTINNQPSTDTPTTTEIPVETGSQASNLNTPSRTTEGSQQTRTTPASVEPSQDSSNSTPTSIPPVSSRTQRITTTITRVSGSSTQTGVVTTTGLVAVPASSSATSSPKLDSNDGNSGSSGLDSSQKRIVIGVVVGVGGALLLGGLAVVAWRIWGRRRHDAGEENDLMDSQLGSSGEKRSSVSGQSPFRSTLDQYHNPAGPVNTASNF